MAPEKSIPSSVSPDVLQFIPNIVVISYQLPLNQTVPFLVNIENVLGLLSQDYVYYINFLLQRTVFCSYIQDPENDKRNAQSWELPLSVYHEFKFLRLIKNNNSATQRVEISVSAS